MLVIAASLIAATAAARPLAALTGTPASWIQAHAAHKQSANAHERSAKVHRRRSHRMHGPLATATAAASANNTFLLGTQTVEPWLDENASGQAEAYPSTATTAGTVSSIAVYVDSHNQARTIFAGLYSNNKGDPGALLTSGSLASPQAGGWNTVNVAATAVNSGATYWIAILGRGGTIFFRDAPSTACYSENSSSRRLHALPASWTAGPQSPDCPISAYAMGTPAPTITPPSVPPVNTGVPTVGGNPVQGQTLTTNTGSWINGPTAYSYEWEDCDSSGANCTAIGGATATSYTLAAGDVNHTIRSVVSASNAAGSSLLPGTSSPTALVTSPPLPVASFTYSPSSPDVGQIVAFDGTGSTCAATPCSYAWTTAGGSLGSGQTLSHAFSAPGAQQVTLTVSDSLGRSSSLAHVVTVSQAAPGNTSPPTINGTPQQGDTLTASPGAWSGDTPMNYSYRWSDGTTGPTDTLSSADVGHTVSVAVTATNDAGNGSATSASVGPVTAPPPAPVPPGIKTAPTISGTPQVGDTLTANPGTWSGDTPMTFTYRWSDGTTGQTDTLPSADAGQNVSVTVTATNDAGNASATSASDGPVTSASSSGNCTVTESSVSSVNAALTPGAVVCLAAGSYSSLSIAASPSSNATVTAAPGAHVVVAGVNLSGANITVSQLHSTGGITINNGGSNDTIDHNDVTEATCGYGIAVFGTYTGSSFNPIANHDVISWNKIHDTGTTCEADALRIQGYANITIVHNDEYNLADPHQYHTDTLQSYQAGVPTSGLVYSYNYAHDLANAGPPFLKDGDVQNVTVTDNLVLRNSWTGIGGMDLHENTTGLVYRNNTELGTSGIVVQGQGSAPNPSLLFDHNVVDNANTSGSTGYTITSDYNDFVDNDEFSWTLGPHDIKGAPAGGYKCGSSCGNGTAAGDDYELANNPNGEGIDWNPATQQYGPTN
jgi:hypothetical protein